MQADILLISDYLKTNVSDVNEFQLSVSLNSEL